MVPGLEGVEVDFGKVFLLKRLSKYMIMCLRNLLVCLFAGVLLSVLKRDCARCSTRSLGVCFAQCICLCLRS